MNPLRACLEYHVSGAIERGEAEVIAEQPVRLLTTIPFQGFYASAHCAAIDNVEDRMLDDGNGDTITGLAEHYWQHDSIDYSEVHENYAKDYVNALAKHTKLELIFDELKSPREYNFETDRIFATIPLGQVEALLARVDQNVLKKAIHDKFTSRPGFHSFYGNRFRDWPPSVRDWDHNQVGTLIEVAIRFWDEEVYAEDIAGSGTLDNILYGALTEHGKRLVRIAGYLREREDRTCP